ncbi:ABC transporter permease [Marinilabiliaceae bacterium ANBcel2]|nr:ABC transporter permease [Marinilabiliaceae bacterium ANBcel2]
MLITNYIKTLFSNIIKHRGFSLVMIAGLAAGIAMGLLLLIYISYETKYDTHFKDSNHIFRLYTKGTVSNKPVATALTPLPLFEEIKSGQSVKAATRLIRASQKTVKTDKGKFSENNFYYSDSTFFNVFDLEFIYKSSQNPLPDTNSVVITEKTALKLFDKRDATGMSIKYQDSIELVVSGVIKEIPENSHFTFNMLTNWLEYKKEFDQQLQESKIKPYEDWLHLNCYTYVKLKEKYDIESLDDLINKAESKLILQSQIVYDGRPHPGNVNLSFKLQPLNQIYLRSNLNNEIKSSGNYTYIKLFSGVALLILIVTAINFMNLTTAKAPSRLKEVAIRKAFGANKREVIIQFITEAIAFSFIALFFALVLTEIFLPVFNNIFNINASPSLLLEPDTFILVFAITIITGLLSGSYPAWFFSKTDSTQTLKGFIKFRKTGVILRGSLMAVQITATLALLILSGIMFCQLHYIKNQEHGYDYNNVLVLEHGDIKHDELKKITDNLSKTEGVKTIGKGNYVPGLFPSQVSFRSTKENSKVILTGVNYVNEGYFKTLNTKLIKGEYFNDKNNSNKVIINESAATLFNLDIESPYKVEMVGGRATSEEHLFKVIGIVKNSAYEGLKKSPRPVIYMLATEERPVHNMVIKYDKKRSESVFNKVSEIEKSEGLSIYRLKNRVNNFYSEEKRYTHMGFMFAISTLIMAILGKTAMAIFIIQYHKKNITIKKYLAAPLTKIVAESFKFYIISLITAIATSIIISHKIAKDWLSQFYIAYTPSFLNYIVPVILIITGSIAIIIFITMKELKK